jgi:hypothetical protein
MSAASKQEQTEILHFVIGDVHGCFNELLLLEKKVQQVAAKAKRPWKIVSVGDLLDRGPFSKQVVQHFLSGEQKGTHKAVMGNHEASFVQYMKENHFKWFKKNHLKISNYIYSTDEQYQFSRWKKGFTRNEYPTLIKGFWLAYGGVETLESYELDPQKPNFKNLPPEHIHYLSQLPMFYETKKFIVTHALPRKSDFIKVRKHLNKKSLITLEIKKSCNDLIWNRERDGVHQIGGKLLISGHTPFKTPRRLTSANVVQIDTHCYGGGQLTAYCPELDRYFSVKSQRTYFQ